MRQHLLEYIIILILLTYFCFTIHRCTNIPVAFTIDRTAARRHFARFGSIHNIQMRARQNACIVEFDSADAAAIVLATTPASNTYEGHVFTVDYTPQSTKNNLKSTRKSTASVEMDLDPEVQTELSAMMGECNGPYRKTTMPTIKATTTNLPLHQQRNASPTMRIEVNTAVSSIVSRNSGSASPVWPKSKTTTEIHKIERAADSIDNAARADLENLMRRPAHTAEDRFRVLDARDKLIRLHTAKTTDLARVVSTLGCCPDLCPEKERLMREATHHIAPFELGSSALVLKQYSRSSADQEFPLAHELRPEPVLQMSMLQLLHRIVDQCDAEDTNLADWFHFVWDRTRSIRKDVAQQELCSSGAVRLVEQCARLHIHCAGRLVAEEPQVRALVHGF